MEHHNTTKDTAKLNTLGTQIIVPNAQELEDYAHLAENDGIMDRKTFNAIKLQDPQAIYNAQGVNNANK